MLKRRTQYPVLSLSNRLLQRLCASSSIVRSIGLSRITGQLSYVLRKKLGRDNDTMISLARAHKVSPQACATRPARLLAAFLL